MFTFGDDLWAFYLQFDKLFVKAKIHFAYETQPMLEHDMSHKLRRVISKLFMKNLIFYNVVNDCHRNFQSSIIIYDVPVECIMRMLVASKLSGGLMSITFPFLFSSGDKLLSECHEVRHFAFKASHLTNICEWFRGKKNSSSWFSFLTSALKKRVRKLTNWIKADFKG